MSENLDKWHEGFYDEHLMKEIGLGGGTINFYKLGKRFVDSEKSIPKEASEVMYYTLSVGHHTGIIDCFECALSVPVDVYEKILALIEEEDVKRKLAGVLNFGEIQIDKTHILTVLPALRRTFGNLEVFNEPGKLSVPLKGDDFIMFTEIIRLLISVRDEPAMYLMVRRNV